MEAIYDICQVKPDLAGLRLSDPVDEVIDDRNLSVAAGLAAESFEPQTSERDDGLCVDTDDVLIGWMQSVRLVDLLRQSGAHIRQKPVRLIRPKDDDSLCHVPPRTPPSQAADRTS